MLITSSYVQTNFPDWGNFFVNELREASSTVLENDIARAEDELREYLPGLTEENITGGIRRHLFNIVLMTGARRLYAGTQTEIPAIIADEYANTINALKRISTASAVDEDKKHRVTVKLGKFDDWFDESSE